MRFFTLTAACVLGVAAAQAATYRVKADHQAGKIHVTVTLNEGDTATEFRMPAWAPGDYRILNFGKGVKACLFTTSVGVVTGSTQPDANRWQMTAPTAKVEYDVVDSGGPELFSDFFRVTRDEFTFDGPAVLGYFVGHEKEAHTLTIEKTNAGGIECSLERVENPELTSATFRAPDYDTLIDCPVVHSVRLRTKDFSVLGKPHKIVAFNRSSGVNLDAFAFLCERIIPQAANLMGGLPYPRYHFMFDFGAGGGGLEHLFSNKIAIGPNFPPEALADFIAHEYFHAWNVKRIRAKALGPFDYQKPAITGTLWWLEGVTDYYSKLLTFKAGIWTRAELFEAISTSAQELSTDSARHKVSADECSRRVWESQNSEGYGGLSYYLKGDVIGFCLDTAIRAESKGKYSLDDVMRALFKECADGKPGYSETRIRELCIQFGGTALGDVYDKCVMKPGDVPINEWLPKLGFVWSDEGIRANPLSNGEAKRLGDAWPN